MNIDFALLTECIIKLAAGMQANPIGAAFLCAMLLFIYFTCRKK